ncbi:MAG: anaerobic ribonucleoside-triphosphate reductase activating protein [Candidatus Gastranaerophilales bacterium]|nr:anaerobic ribonucleoside-triphosphate reductase activating protein [Candidatus Gastranaerophilales bacterium]
MQFVIGGIKKSSLLDYPDKISAIVFTQGCNFNCGYCHNPDLLKTKSKKDIFNSDAFFDFLKKRHGKLDGVVITGGECTLQKDLKFFIEKIKELNFLVKLDTNGYKPEVIKELLTDNLIDYIAMDIKAPLEKYSLVTNTITDTSKIKESINLIMQSSIDYEFRTTILPSLLQYNDFEKIANLIKGAKKYYLQKFIVQSEINDPSLKQERNYTEEELIKIINLLKKYIQTAEIR